FTWNLVDLKRVRWEGPELAPGRHQLEFDFKYDGLGPATIAFGNFSGIGASGTGVLKVDGAAVATEKMERTLPLILQWDESLDIGSDTGTPVNDDDYSTPFPFTGKLNKITLDIDRPKLSPEDIKRLQETARAAGDGPSGDAGQAVAEAAPPEVSSGIGIGLKQKVELHMDKLETCRKEAIAKKLGLVERISFVRACVK
ncbi:MAG: arylsulfatase, partial [Bradyrhizobium sp.]|nr:arylsulfatase [Bradyrhizobium sp.]